ncbi:MAG: RES family NAD+ phosphorylase [Gammaproteobacteria bacterium]
MQEAIKLIDLKQQKHYRIIPSTFPPINFFEDIVDPSEMDLLYEIEGLTNERLRQEAGEIFLVAPEDRVSGPGSSVVMATFTHIYKPSRFTDGSYGVYYAGLSQETAIRETVFHREIFLQSTNEDPCEITMRVYQGKVLKEFHDIRTPDYQHLHHPDHYQQSQEFGRMLRAEKAWGLIYHSVRHEGGMCIAALRPPAISIPVQGAHLRYYWDGNKIAVVFNTETVMNFD